VVERRLPKLVRYWSRRPSSIARRPASRLTLSWRTISGRRWRLSGGGLCTS